MLQQFAYLHSSFSKRPSPNIGAHKQQLAQVNEARRSTGGVYGEDAEHKQRFTRRICRRREYPTFRLLSSTTSRTDPHPRPPLQASRTEPVAILTNKRMRDSPSDYSSCASEGASPVGFRSTWGSPADSESQPENDLSVDLKSSDILDEFEDLECGEETPVDCSPHSGTSSQSAGRLPNPILSEIVQNGRHLEFHHMLPHVGGGECAAVEKPHSSHGRGSEAGLDCTTLQVIPPTVAVHAVGHVHSLLINMLRCGFSAGENFQANDEMVFLQQRHFLEELAARHNAPTNMTNSPTRNGKRALFLCPLSTGSSATSPPPLTNSDHLSGIWAIKPTTLGPGSHYKVFTVPPTQ